MSALPDEGIIQSNPLATVTTNFVVLRDSEVQASMIISLSDLGGIEKINTTYPGLLVISMAFFLTAAAALCSKDGHGAHLPIALLGLAFVIAYVVSRRASVAFLVGSAVIETGTGGLTEADAVIHAVKSARANPDLRRERSTFALSLELTGAE